jgi:hypothetical protein
MIITVWRQADSPQRLTNELPLTVMQNHFELPSMTSNISLISNLEKQLVLALNLNQ